MSLAASGAWAAEDAGASARVDWLAALGSLAAFVFFAVACGIVVAGGSAILLRQRENGGDDRPNSGLMRHVLLRRMLQRLPQSMLALHLAKYLFLSAAAIAAFDGLSAFFAFNRLGGMAISGIALAAGALLWFLAELLPRSLSLPTQEKLAVVAAPVLFPLFLIAFPFRLLLRAPTEPRSLEQGGRERTEDHLVDEENLKNLIGAGLVESLPEEGEKEMIEGVFEMRDATAEEIMTPRLEIEALSLALTQAGMVEAMRKFPHNRAPVFDEQLDRIVGVLLKKEVLLNPENDFKTFMREPLFVPNTRTLSELLREFKVKRTRLAVVVDEFGGVSGVVSLMDLFAEILGEGFEEAEPLELKVRQRRDGSFRIAGACELTDVKEAMKIDFPDDRGRTLGGFIMNTLGHMPHRGSTLEHAGHEFKVLRVAERRVQSVEVRRIPEPSLAEEKAAENGGPRTAVDVAPAEGASA